MATSEERPTPDPDTVRETLREHDAHEDDDGPDVEELPEDPAYDPDEERLKDIKGG